jgi:hypothetical protein
MTTSSVVPSPTTTTTASQQPTGTTSEAQPRTRDVAAEEAAGVVHDATAAAGDVAKTAKDEAGELASEAKDHARRLYRETKDELTSQASTQQTRAASGLSALGAELRQMADRSDGGAAADLARQGAERVDAAAAWLGDREPGDVLDDLSRWARRRPGTFLAAAAAVGVIAGRLTRGLADDARADGGTQDDVTGSASGDGGAYSTSRALPSQYSSAAHPLASDDLPPAADPDDSLAVAQPQRVERGTP